jgi:hypothetical protein
VVELRSFFDRDRPPEQRRDLDHPVRRPFDHQRDRAPFEVAYPPPPAECLASVLGHPCLDPSRAPLFGALNTYPLFLLLDSRGWRNRCLLHNHVWRFGDEATVIFFVRLGLSLALSLDRVRGGGHLGLLGLFGLLASSAHEI